MQEYVERILFSRQEIDARVRELADELTKRLDGTRPIVVCVLKGAAFFHADLCRALPFDVDIDFISVSTYGLSAVSTGCVRLFKDLEYDVFGRPVVIVEDVVDTGLTLRYLRERMAMRKPASVTTVAFLDKRPCHPDGLSADLCGFSVGEEFLVGYGLDYAGRYRNLPYVASLKLGKEEEL